MHVHLSVQNSLITSLLELELMKLKGAHVWSHNVVPCQTLQENQRIIYPSKRDILAR